MSKKFYIALLVTAVFVAPMYAQQAEKPAVKADELTEMDQLRIENFNLQFTLAQQISLTNACLKEKGPLVDQVNNAMLQQNTLALRQAIEKAHPGFTFNPNTGLLKKKDDKNVGDKKQ